LLSDPEGSNTALNFLTFLPEVNTRC